MATAVQKVLNTPELLQAILLELPPRPLILAQSVTTKFKTMIYSSTEIQQELFLQSPPRTEDGHTAVNPFLQYLPLRLGMKCIMSVSDGNWRYAELKMGSQSLVSNKRRIMRNGDRLSVSVFDMHLGDKPQMPLRGSFKDMLIADKPLNIRIDVNTKARTNFKTVTITTLGGVIEACCAQFDNMLR